MAKQKEKKKVKEKKEKNVIDVDKLCDDDLRKITNKSDSNYKKLSKEGYIKGCGCLLELKIPNEKKHCPAKKW